MAEFDMTGQLRRAFEDSYTHRSDVAEFAEDFVNAGLLDPETASATGGRRALVQEAYSAVDWHDPSAVEGLLGIWALHAERLEHRLDHEALRSLQRELAACELVYENGAIHAGQSSYRDFEPTEIESRWPLDHFKLFVTHVAARKVDATELKASLAYYNVSAFVAHEDIEPSQQWQTTIETALHEMDALAALLTVGFHESKWTDQEIGFALGRGVLAVGLRYDIDPYGFMGRDQALNARGKDAKTLARDLVVILLRNTRTRSQMAEALAARLARSYGYAQSEEIASLLTSATPLSDRAKTIIERGFYANHEVNAAGNVREVLSALIGRRLQNDAA